MESGIVPNLKRCHIRDGVEKNDVKLQGKMDSLKKKVFGKLTILSRGFGLYLKKVLGGTLLAGIQVFLRQQGFGNYNGSQYRSQYILSWAEEIGQSGWMPDSSRSGGPFCFFFFFNLDFRF